MIQSYLFDFAALIFAIMYIQENTGSVSKNRNAEDNRFFLGITYKYIWLFCTILCIIGSFAFASYLSTTTQITSVNGTVTTNYGYVQSSASGSMVTAFGTLLVVLIFLFVYQWARFMHRSVTT